MKKRTRIGKTAVAVITGAAMLFAAGTMAFAGEETEESVWEIPAAGIDITLPDSWKESDLYKMYQTMEFEPELIVTTAVMYDIPEDELMAEEEELGDSEELYAYLDEHVNDLFVLLSVKDTMSEEDVEKILAEASENAQFTKTEIGKTDGWTFYDLSGDIFRRSDPEAENGAAMTKILEDLPEIYKNMRFYEPEKEPEIEVGTKLSFKTVDFEGNEVDSAELFAGNKYTMVNLWMSWCTYCVEEMPELEKMNAEFAKEDCGIIGVMLDGDEEEPLAEGKRIAEENGVTFPLLVPTEDMKEQMIATGYPTTVFVDSEGVVVSEPIKGMATDLYRETMEQLLAGSGAEEAKSSEEADSSKETAAADEAQGYSVLVQDESGNPIPEAVVQFCSDSECMMDTTGEDGVASFDAGAGTYTVHILKAPEEFETTSEEFTAPEEPGTVVITLQAKK